MCHLSRESDVLDYKSKVLGMTNDYARRVIGDRVSDLKVIFSRNMRYYHAVCRSSVPLIIYNDRFVRLNSHNDDVLRYVVVEECAHLMYPDHTKDFYQLCLDLGVDTSVEAARKLTIVECYPEYTTLCHGCGKAKYYYHEPQSSVCDCGGKLRSKYRKEGYYEGFLTRAKTTKSVRNKYSCEVIQL